MTSVCIQVSHGTERRVLLKNQQLFMLAIIFLILTSLMLYSTVILCTGIAQGHGSKSHTGLNFFRPYFHYCSSSVHYCKDCLHIQFFICSSLFFSYLQSVFLKWEIRYTAFYSYCAGYPKYLQQRLTGEIRGWEMQKDL